MKTFLYAIFGILILVILSSGNLSDSNYLLTASISHQGVNAGMKILEEGGTAMDAALSVALSEIAETHGKYVSYAGTMNLVYFEASSGKLHNMNAYFNVPKDETNPSTIPVSPGFDMANDINDSIYGRTILVPGFMKGIEEAHKRFGKVPFNRLFDNAIKIAEEGVIWNEEDEREFGLTKRFLFRHPETRKIFTKPDNNLYEVGDTFKQPDLVQTLEKVREEGAEYMYTGEWGKKYVKTARKMGGNISMEDMANYDVIWTEPVHGIYHGYDVYFHNQFGGTRLVNALNMAEEARLSEKGHYTVSDLGFATLYQVLQASLYASYFSTNNPEYFGSGIDLSNKARLTKETSKKIWNKWVSMNDLHENLNLIKTSDHSSAIVAIDKYGNMVAILHTINTIDWGCTGLFIDGVSVSDAGSNQQELMQQTPPGGRIKDITVPGIILKDDKPILGFSCINNGVQNQTFTAITDILDYKMTPQQAVDTPSIGEFNFVDGVLNMYIEPNCFSDSLLFRAAKRGVVTHESWNVQGMWWSGIYCNPENGKVSGTKVWLR